MDTKGLLRSNEHTTLGIIKIYFVKIFDATSPVKFFHTLFSKITSISGNSNKFRLNYVQLTFSYSFIFRKKIFVNLI